MRTACRLLLRVARSRLICTVVHLAIADHAQITNIFSKKILSKRCLREIKLLHHFRGHKNVGPCCIVRAVLGSGRCKLTS